MILDKFLSRKGCRVVAHSILAAAGLALIYLLARMVMVDIQQEYPINWWVFSIESILLLWIVTLGSMLAKAELTDWR